MIKRYDGISCSGLRIPLFLSVILDASMFVTVYEFWEN